MKICLVGPGIMPIPPNGWAAVESLIFDYYLVLTQLGHEVKIVNTPDRDKIIQEVNSFEADVVHLEYDVFYELLPRFNTKLVCISSHYPYIDQLDKHHMDNYSPIFRYMIENCNRFPIFAISEKDRNTFINWGANPNKVIFRPNGANPQRFKYCPQPNNPCASITLAKIDPQRKRQYLTKEIRSVHYVGRGPYNHTNYLGEWTDEQKFNNLTHFANSVLLSTGENGTPLCLKESLICGLGIVCTAQAASELDDKKPWITVVDDRCINDVNHLDSVIAYNRSISLKHRDEIREYGMQWDWAKLVPKYVENLKSLI